MNQVIAYERLIYWAFLQEKHNDPDLVTHPSIKKKPVVEIAFGKRNEKLVVEKEWATSQMLPEIKLNLSEKKRALPVMNYSN